MLGLTPLLQALNASVRLGSTSRRKAEPQLWGLGTSKPGNQAMATSFFRSAARRGLAWASSMGSPLNVCLRNKCLSCFGVWKPCDYRLPRAPGVIASTMLPTVPLEMGMLVRSLASSPPKS